MSGKLDRARQYALIPWYLLLISWHVLVMIGASIYIIGQDVAYDLRRIWRYGKI